MASPTVHPTGPAPEKAIDQPMHPALETWHHFSKNLGAVIGLFIIVLIVLLAIFADLIAPHSPIQQFRDAFLTPPVWVEGGTTKFLLGTDDVGRDILSRLIHGARYSLFIGLLVVTISLGSGIVLGLTAGFFSGFVGDVIMRLMDIMLALPSLLLEIVIVAILGPSLTNAILAVAITYLPHFTRVARADDPAGRASLLALRGIGPWSADVYYLMALRRPDVWPVGDLALAVALQEVKRLRRRPDAERLLAMSAAWAPWRSVAARLLWHYYLTTRRTRAN